MTFFKKKINVLMGFIFKFGNQNVEVFQEKSTSKIIVKKKKSIHNKDENSQGVEGRGKLANSFRRFYFNKKL